MQLHPEGRALVPVQVGPDAWGLDDDDGGNVHAGLQPDAAFADAWNDSGSTVHPGATSIPNEWATSNTVHVADTAARGGNSSPQGSQSSDTTRALPSGSAGVEDLRFQPVLAQVTITMSGLKATLVPIQPVDARRAWGTGQGRRLDGGVVPACRRRMPMTTTPSAGWWSLAQAVAARQA